MAEMFDVEDVVPSTPEELRRQEIEELKAGWASDPCFDIEDTEGFEDVREELLQFRQEMEFKWEEQRLTRIRKMAQEFGFVIGNDGLYCVEHPTHVEPKRFIESMEKILDHIDALEDRLEQVEIKLDRIGRGR
jgi:molecular chaperone GrpE (heat shock protein)